MPMISKSGIGWSLLAAFSICCGRSSIASAQTKTKEPIHPVFGPAQTTTSTSESADLSLTVAESYETDELGSSSPIAPSVFRTSGLYSSLKADTDYVRNGRHLKFAGSAGSNLRYYPNLNAVLPVNHYAGAGLIADFLHRATVSVNQTFMYAPSYLYSLFPSVTTPLPGLVSTAAADYPLNTARSYTSDTTTILSQRLTSHVTAQFRSNYRFTDFAGALTASNLKSYDLIGEVSYRLNRTSTLRLGYTFRDGQFGSGLRVKEHGIDAGVEFDRALSRRRRAMLRFSVGPAIVDVPPLADHISLNGPRLPQQSGLLAEGAVSYDLSTTWRAQGSYRRGVTFVEGFSSPLFSSGYGVEVRGFINRRLDLVASAGYANGQAAPVFDRSVVRSHTVDVRLRYALGKTWAAYAEYLYYRYRLDPDLLSSPAFGPRLDRNGLHIGLTLWMGVRRK
jgi:hypothetical protein